MRRKTGFGLAAAALAALLWCGCAGVLSEKVDETGKTERVRVSTTDKWSTWDRNSTKQNESCFMLLKESTF
jgi:hypothetical protein